MTTKKIRKNESSALINSLTAGVVPRIGLRHIAVGRVNEVKAFLSDLATIEDGGAAFRFISGRYGDGKSFLLQLIRTNAMERNFVVADADLSPERRLVGTKGQGVATYRELVKNLSTNTRPDGGGLEIILQKWINNIKTSIIKKNDLDLNDPQIYVAVRQQISKLMDSLAELPNGYNFGIALHKYWQGIHNEDEEMKQSALRWLRAEYPNKTEARNTIGISTIIEDQTWYDFTKILALFVVKAGYKGLIIFLDEGVNLYKISHKQSRESNYEKILTIFNDTMQGKAHNIGVFLSGTPQFIDDERRGLFSYEALRSRLADNSFVGRGFVDYTGPVLKLNKLTPEEIYVLLERLCEVHSSHFGYETKLSSANLTGFLNSVISRLGADQLLTPREIIRDFLGLLNILLQNSEIDFETLISDPNLVKSASFDPEQITKESDDMFAKFDL